MGDYAGRFKLLVYTDASKYFYGSVIYLKDCSTDKVSFLCAKNRLIPQGSTKSIPVLELLGLAFGVEIAHKLKLELAGAYCLVNIVGVNVYTDSMIALNWLSSKATKFLKIERKGVLINNALQKIVTSTEECPMNFYRVEGSSNPADFVTRGTSTNVLLRSILYSGACEQAQIKMFSVPYEENDSYPINVCAMQIGDVNADIIPYDKYSSFRKLCRVMHHVRKYIFKL